MNAFGNRMGAGLWLAVFIVAGFVVALARCT
jgi:hypothetical protein